MAHPLIYIRSFSVVCYQLVLVVYPALLYTSTASRPFGLFCNAMAREFALVRSLNMFLQSLRMEIMQEAPPLGTCKEAVHLTY